MDYSIINSRNELENYVTTGDILLMQGTGAPSWIIRVFTRSSWSHVGMIVKEKNIANGRAMLLECIRHSSHHNVVSRTLSVHLQALGNGKFLTEDGEVYHYKEGGITLCPLDKQLQKYNGRIIALRKLVVPPGVRESWAVSMKPIIESFIGGFSLISTSLAKDKMPFHIPLKVPRMDYDGSDSSRIQTDMNSTISWETPIGTSSQVIYDGNLIDLCMSQRGCLFKPDTTVTEDVMHGYNGGGGLKKSYFCSSLIAAAYFKMGILNPSLAKLPVEHAPCDFSESGHLEVNPGFYLENKTQYINFV